MRPPLTATHLGDTVSYAIEPSRPRTMSNVDRLLSLGNGRVPVEPATNTAANPILVNAASESVAPITRADQDMHAPGPTIAQGAVEMIRSKNATLPNSSTSPAGRPVIGSAGGLP